MSKPFTAFLCGYKNNHQSALSLLFTEKNFIPCVLVTVPLSKHFNEWPYANCIAQICPSRGQVKYVLL